MMTNKAVNKACSQNLSPPRKLEKVIVTPPPINIATHKIVGKLESISINRVSRKFQRLSRFLNILEKSICPWEFFGWILAKLTERLFIAWSVLGLARNCPMAGYSSSITDLTNSTRALTARDLALVGISLDVSIKLTRFFSFFQGIISRPVILLPQ